MKEIISKKFDVLVKEFKTKGIKQYNMDDIAQILEISKKTLYKYVGNKQEVIQLILIRNQRKVIKIITSLFESYLLKERSFIEMSVEGVAQLISEALSNSDKYLSDLEVYHKDEYKKFKDTTKQMSIDFYSKLIKVGIKDGYIKEDLNIEIFCKFMYVNIQAILYDKSIFESSLLRTKEFKRMFWEINMSNCWTDKAKEEMKQTEQLI